MYVHIRRMELMKSLLPYYTRIRFRMKGMLLYRQVDMSPSRLYSVVCMWLFTGFHVAFEEDIEVIEETIISVRKSHFV